jgi:hypothetical protein
MKPYTVIAMHAIDGQVVLGSFDSRAERDAFFYKEYAAFMSCGFDEHTLDICLGEVHGMTPKAEEADIAEALMAQYVGKADTQTRRKAQRNVI